MFFVAFIRGNKSCVVLKCKRSLNTCVVIFSRNKIFEIFAVVSYHKDEHQAMMEFSLSNFLSGHSIFIWVLIFLLLSLTLRFCTVKKDERDTEYSY